VNIKCTKVRFQSLSQSAVNPQSIHQGLPFDSEGWDLYTDEKTSMMLTWRLVLVPVPNTIFKGKEAASSRYIPLIFGPDKKERLERPCLVCLVKVRLRPVYSMASSDDNPCFECQSDQQQRDGEQKPGRPTGELALLETLVTTQLGAWSRNWVV